MNIKMPIDYNQLEFYLNSREYTDKNVKPFLEKEELKKIETFDYLMTRSFSSDYNFLKSAVRKRKDYMTNKYGGFDLYKDKSRDLFNKVFDSLFLYNLENKIIKERKSENGIFLFFTYHELRFEKLMKANSNGASDFLKKIIYVG